MVEQGVAPAHALYTPIPSEDMVDQLMGKDLVFSVNNYVTLQVCAGLGSSSGEGRALCVSGIPPHTRGQEGRLYP